MIKKTLAFSNPAYLSLRDRQMVIKLPEIEANNSIPERMKQEAVRTIPIEDIGVVVLESKRITITSALMDALLQNNCAVITCSDKGMPSGLFMPLACNTTQNERFRDQISASQPLRKQLWQQTVRQKILNQAEVLNRYGKSSIKPMLVMASDVRSGDVDNKEAQAAVYYWRNVFIGHSDFVRSRDGEAPNNLLNYGYAILRAVIARALVSSGLLPTLGIHHHNRYNAYCLADDIMEPYRPYIDELVINIMEMYDDYSEMTKDIKMQLLNIPVIDVTIDGKSSPLMIAASQTTASLARCFSGEVRQIVYPQY